MSDGIAESCVVLELEADLEYLEVAIQTFTPREQPARRFTSSRARAGSSPVSLPLTTRPNV